jgi:hypothetical protein
MKLISGIIYIDRQEAANILKVPKATLEMWAYRKSKPDLIYKPLKGKRIYYKLEVVESFLKDWDLEEYGNYLTRRTEMLRCLAENEPVKH